MCRERLGNLHISTQNDSFVLERTVSSFVQNRTLWYSSAVLLLLLLFLCPAFWYLDFALAGSLSFLPGALLFITLLMLGQSLARRGKFLQQPMRVAFPSEKSPNGADRTAIHVDDLTIGAAQVKGVQIRAFRTDEEQDNYPVHLIAPPLLIELDALTDLAKAQELASLVGKRLTSLGAETEPVLEPRWGWGFPNRSTVVMLVLGLVIQFPLGFLPVLLPTRIPILKGVFCAGILATIGMLLSLLHFLLFRSSVRSYLKKEYEL